MTERDRAKVQADYYKANKEKILAKIKIYRANNKEKIRLASAARYAASKEKVLARLALYRIKNKNNISLIKAVYYENNKERFRAYRNENKEKIRDISSKYREANREKLNARSLAYYAANKERILVRHSIWMANNKDKVRDWVMNNKDRIAAYSHNRRARKIAGGGKLSLDIKSRLYKLQKGLCVCCRQPLGTNYHLDHIMPLALGGANEDWNIQLLRNRCNNQKQAKHPVDFMQQRGFLL